MGWQKERPSFWKAGVVVLVYHVCEWRDTGNHGISPRGTTFVSVERSSQSERLVMLQSLACPYLSRALNTEGQKVMEVEAKSEGVSCYGKIFI